MEYKNRPIVINYYYFVFKAISYEAAAVNKIYCVLTEGNTILNMGQ